MALFRSGDGSNTDKINVTLELVNNDWFKRNFIGALELMCEQFNWVAEGDATLDFARDKSNEMLESVLFDVPIYEPYFYPEIVYLDPIAAEVYTGGAVSRAVNANMINGFIVGVTPLAINNALSWLFFARAGTYTLTILTITSSTYGRLTPNIDGVDDSEFIELYQAGTTYNALKTISIVVPTDGMHYLALKCLGKHASSTNYNWFISDLWMTRTGV